MKTTIEVSGFEIKIEEMDGKIMVSAMKDNEVVEEFELESEEMSGEEMSQEEMEDDDDMSAFGEEEDMEEEGDFDEEDMEDEEEMEDDEEEGKLESFSYFVKNRKK
jgi:hypothetical protein